jgi:hypothetical protein
VYVSLILPHAAAPLPSFWGFPYRACLLIGRVGWRARAPLLQKGRNRNYSVDCWVVALWSVHVLSSRARIQRLLVATRPEALPCRKLECACCKHSSYDLNVGNCCSACIIAGILKELCKEVYTHRYKRVTFRLSFDKEDFRTATSHGCAAVSSRLCLQI